MQEASLAFYQNFYTNVTLYVAQESGALPLIPATPAPVAVMTPVAAPLPVDIAPPAAAVSAPAPPVVATPKAAVGPARLPSLGSLGIPASPIAPVAPVAPPEVTAAPVMAVPPVATVPPAPPKPFIQPTATQSPVANTPFTTLGSNPNGLIILVRMDPDRFPRLQRNVFLNNVLKAIRLIVEDTVLINVESHLPVALSTLRQRGLQGKQFIGFGKNLLDVAVHKAQLYEPVLLVGDAAYLPAAEISLLEEDLSHKKRLWQAMQRMFLMGA